MGDRQSVEALQWLVYIGRTRNMLVMGGTFIWLGSRMLKLMCTVQRLMKSLSNLGCFWHGCLCMRNRNKPIAKTEETCRTGIRKLKRGCRKSRTPVIILFRSGGLSLENLRENLGLENEICSYPNVKNSPINIRDALYGGRTEAGKTYYMFVEGRRCTIRTLKVCSLTFVKYGKFPSDHPKVYVGADCPPVCLDRLSNARFCIIGYYHPVLPHKATPN